MDQVLDDLAGMPLAVTSGGISSTTTLPAPMMAQAPIVRSGMTLQPMPNRRLLRLGHSRPDELLGPCGRNPRSSHRDRRCTPY